MQIDSFRRLRLARLAAGITGLQEVKNTYFSAGRQPVDPFNALVPLFPVVGIRTVCLYGTVISKCLRRKKDEGILRESTCPNFHSAPLLLSPAFV